jgi:RNA polymerase sigma factor (sigma-70 family)
VGWVTEWSAQAACRTTDPDELFTQGAAQDRAKVVCTGCPVRTECLADALDNRVEFGVWGGMTDRERRALLRRRPAVTSWRRLLETARTEYERGASILEPAQGSTWLSVEEEAAFSAVFRDRFVPLVGFLIKAGASRHDAEDAAQNALEELAKMWHRVDRPTPWLRTTAFRMWLKTVHRIRPDELTDEIPDQRFEDHSADVAEKIAMVQLLRRLPLLQRTVMAFDIDGCTPSETAEALGMPAVNVRQNLRRARLNLERLLEDDEGGAE